MKSYSIWNEHLCTPSQRMTQKLAWSERRQVKKGAKKKKKKMKATEAEKERGELSPVPLVFPCVLYLAPPPTI